MKNLLNVLIVLLVGFAQNVQAQDSLYFVSQHYSYQMYERWNQYDPSEIDRRARKAVRKAVEFSNSTNGLNIRAKSSIETEMDHGLYMDLGQMDFVLAGVKASSNNPYPLGSINQMRNDVKAATSVIYVPDWFVVSNTDNSSPLERSNNNDNPDLNSNDDLRSNIFILKETLLTELWDQDSTLVFYLIAHAMGCHNNGFVDNFDPNNCNLFSTINFGCYDVPDNDLNQYHAREFWKANSFPEVSIDGLESSIELCEDSNESLSFSTNGTDVSIVSSTNINASLNGNTIDIVGTSSGSGWLEVISTDGTSDIVQQIIEVNVLEHETATVNETLCGDDQLEMENGEFTSSSTTITILGGAVNGCDRVVMYNITNLEHESIDSIITIHKDEIIILPDGTELDDQDNEEDGFYTIPGGAANGCDLVVNWTVDVISSTGIVEEHGLSAGPNPFMNHITIRDDGNKIVKAALFSLNGQIVLKENLTSMGVFTLDVSTVGSGMYILKLESFDGEVFVEKFFKQQ